MINKFDPLIRSESLFFDSKTAGKVKRNRSKKDSRKSRCPSRRKRGEIHPELTLMVMSRRREDETREYHLVLYLQGNTFVARRRNRLLTFLYLCLGIFFPPFRDILVTPLNVLKKMREIEEIEGKKKGLSLEICLKMFEEESEGKNRVIFIIFIRHFIVHRLAVLQTILRRG